MTRTIQAASFLAALWLAPQFAYANVDLGIGDDETYKRPVSWALLMNGEPSPANTQTAAAETYTGPSSRAGVSIAWRNANQVEEVEVKVRNLGTEPGQGRVWVDILDETGGILLTLTPAENERIMNVPAADQGGRTGKIIRMQADRRLNQLIDRFDRARVRYGVRATVETQGPDTNPFDNSKTKSWNLNFRVNRGQLSVFNYIFKNHSRETVRLRWVYEQTAPPPGWEIRGLPSLLQDQGFELAPDAEIRGALTMQAPAAIDEGAFLEARLSLVRVADGSMFQQHEWFQVFDTILPIVSNYRIVRAPDHRVAIQVLVADKGSGVLEATGVQTEFSLDGGRTWAARAHNYKTGNFVTPTLFETVLGPFAPDVTLHLRLSASDTAGNVQTVIPQDATTLDAPAGAEFILDRIAQPAPAGGNRGTEIFDLDSVGIDELKRRLNKADLNLDLNNLNIQPTTRVQLLGDDLLRTTTVEVKVR